MKNILLIFIGILSLSTINTSNNFFRRKLQEIPKNEARNLVDSTNVPMLMLVGFGKYDGNTFNIYFKNYNYSFSYENLNLTTKISYQNGDNVTEINCSITEVGKSEADTIIYSCPKGNLNDSINVKILDGNYKFFNITNNAYTNAIVKDESFLAKITKEDILSRNTSLNFNTFYFDSVSVTSNKVELKGDLKEVEKDKTYTLQLTKSYYKCNVTKTAIKFNLTETIRDNLIGKMIYVDSDEPKILIFSNKTVDDSFYYSNLTGFLGFDKYEKPTSTSPASNRAHFRGTSDIFQKYLMFNVAIKTTTMNLFQKKVNTSINAIAKGERDDYNSDFDNNLIIYNIIFEDTKNIEILEMHRNGSFQVSNNNRNYRTINVGNLTHTEKLMEDDEIKYQSFNYPSQGIIQNDTSFYFIIIIPNDIQISNGQKQASLSYFSIDDDKRKETNLCFIKKINTTYYNFSCSPRHDINTLVSSLDIKFEDNINTKNRLRFLDSAKNITQLYLEEESYQNQNIYFEYNQTIKNFIKKSSSGLSGGAITGIVLASVAAIFAVGVIIYCLTRKAPPKMPPNNVNFQDSSININK